jgi:hypothetical protein
MTRLSTKYWRTREFYLAAYLFARGAIIVGIHPQNSGVVFTFLDSFDRQSWSDEFKSGKPLIDARTYACAILTLQQKGLDALLEFHGSN